MKRGTLIVLKSLLMGLMALTILMAVYFVTLTFVSGWEFTKMQFLDFWYYIVTLALGFGLQISLYSYLKSQVSQLASKKILTATGSTSTLAMISCCTHYLVNILPILGITGLVTFVAQYQVHLFGVGIFFNLLGLIYLSSKIITFHKEQT